MDSWGSLGAGISQAELVGAGMGGWVGSPDLNQGAIGADLASGGP